MASQGTDLNRKAWCTLSLIVFVLIYCSAKPRNVIANIEDALELGKTRTGQIRGGRTQSFNVPLTQGQFAEIIVEQHGAILVATLFDSQRREVLEMDSTSGGYGPIYLSTIAASSGDYRLEIQSVNKWAIVKDYNVTLKSLRDPSATDRSVVNAQLAFSRGRKNFKSKNSTAAIEAYKNSLAYWQSSEDHHWQAVTQYALSEVYRTIDRSESEKCLKETLRILDSGMAENDWRLKASALNDLGILYSSAGQSEASLSALSSARELFVAHGDQRGQASALNGLAGIQRRAGNFTLAREMLKQARDLRIAENDKPGASTLLGNLSVISDRIGEPEEALAYALQALRDYEEAGELRPADRPRVAAVLNNIAAANDKLGRWDQAFEFYDKALAKYDERDPDRAAPLDNKGELYAALGNSTKARECYEDALRVLAAAGKPNPDLKAGILVHLGQLFVAEGDLATALKYFEEARSLPAEKYRLADVNTNLGEALALEGELNRAMEAYQKALDIQVELKNKRGQALALQKRGEARARTGKTSEALDDFNRALVFWKGVKDRRGEASTLNNIARVERERGNFDIALARSGDAIRIIESLRTNISSRQLRASYFAAQDNYYELDVDLKMQLSRKEKRTEFLAAALESAERSRARVLLDTLNEAGLSRGEFNDNSNPQLSKLIQQRVNLLNKLSAKAQARTNALSVAANPAQIAAFDKEINQLTEASEALETQIRSQNPRFANLTKPQPAKLREIQEQLDVDTILIEYFLGETRSYVWIVTHDSIDGVELPARAQVEALAQRVYDALSARGRDEKNESGAQKMERVARSEGDFHEASRLLSQMVLDKIGARLGQKRLLIVADGALQTLPFGVLPAPQSARALQTPASKPNNVTAATANTPLLASNEIVSSPSASVLVLQRRELAGRKPAPLAVAVLADPVFDDKDSRVSAELSKNRPKPTTRSLTPPPSATSVSGNNSFQTRALSEIGLGEPGRIRRLEFSRQEATAIFKVTNPNQTFKALNFKASRATAMSPELSKYRIIHLATHGVMNLGHPELSGVLFSMVDEKGRPASGYLGLNEIYNLNLPADLVVLSACETGIGKQIKGEGLIALTRGFMHAGAERVVSSLWRVDDQATAELMKEFYIEMFVNKLKPAAALRAAQRKLSQQNAWRKPHFWAGFVLQGEWR